MDQQTAPAPPLAFLDADSAAVRATGWLLCAVLAVLGLGASLVFAVGVAERFSAPGLAAFAAWLAMTALVLRDSGWRAVLAVVAVSLLLRGVSADLASGAALGADPMNYANLAQAVLDGRGLVTDDWQYGDGLRAYFPPFYPLLLAGWWAVFGVSTLSTLAMNTAIDGLAAWALADAARRLGVVPAAARAAGLVCFAWPAFALGAGLPQKESLTVLLVMLLLRGMAIWLAADPREARRWHHGLKIGLWWGMLGLTQASLALAPGFIAIVLAARRGLAPVVWLGLTALPALLLVLTPWWLRNWLVLGTFVPLTTASGMMANSALGALRVPFPPSLFDLPEPERGAVMGQLARAELAAKPLAALTEMVRSLGLGFAYEEASLARFRHTAPPIDLVTHARLAPLLQGTWAGVLLCALAACWRGLRRGMADPLAIHALVLLVAIVSVNLWFEFGERHRLILTPFLLAMAAGFWLCRDGDRAPRQAGAPC